MKQLQRRTCGWMVAGFYSETEMKNELKLSEWLVPMTIQSMANIYNAHDRNSGFPAFSFRAPWGFESRPSKRLPSKPKVGFGVLDCILDGVDRHICLVSCNFLTMTPWIGPSLRSMVNCILANLPRRDRYERNINVYWVEGNLRGKKLSLGRKILRTCIHASKRSRSIIIH